MVVQHNMTAINANRYFGMNNSKLAKSLEKLSSGYAINRAGDNAAGLAVSEKMRAQISGINQGVKNAQDGISMVQTFEGALTETDSILQRMRTLATQSANGTYQDDVDREAIQLEYDQLNDELNQIADTDFNGVVVLNGGQMADGLKQVDGEFDYKNKAGQVAASNAAALVEAQAAADEKIAAAKAEMDAAQEALNALGAEDISLGGNGSSWNTIDDHEYSKAAADEVWKALLITDDGTNTGNVDVSKVTEISITFQKNAAGEWEIRDGYDNQGTEYTAAKLADAVTSVDNREDATNVGKGGFEATLAGGAKLNAIFNDKDAKEGDTVTIKLTNAPEQIYAPSNAGFADNSVKYTGGAGDKVTAAGDLGVEVKVQDNQMTSDVKDALDNLFGNATNGKLEVNYSAKDGAIGHDQAGTTALAANDIILGGQNIGAVGTAGSKITIDGTDYFIKLDNGTAPTTISVAMAKADGTEGTALFDIKLNTNVSNPDGTFSAIKMEGVLKADTYDYSTATGIDASAGTDKKLNNSVQLQAAKDLLNSKTEAYNKAVEAKPQSIDDLFQGVSKSDSNDASTATLTYKDNITLQVGARTKDSVNFTFKYASDGLGELEADMDCSARGLGTDKLSLSTQESANAAIDKIDNALNKVSMVRGTFGAIQNRLEHKIDNLNVTSENLTSAESRIRDTNMAEEMMNFTKNQILSQASQSMLAQANQLPQGVLSLLQ
ncbi:MAG: flagellin [Oscillospiraceae bacterium]